MNKTCLARPPHVVRVEREISANVFLDNKAYRKFLKSHCSWHGNCSSCSSMSPAKRPLYCISFTVWFRLRRPCCRVPPPPRLLFWLLNLSCCYAWIHYLILFVIIVLWSSLLRAVRYYMFMWENFNSTQDFAIKNIKQIINKKMRIKLIIQHKNLFGEFLYW